MDGRRIAVRGRDFEGTIFDPDAVLVQHYRIWDPKK